MSPTKRNPTQRGPIPTPGLTQQSAPWTGGSSAPPVLDYPSPGAVWADTSKPAAPPAQQLNYPPADTHSATHAAGQTAALAARVIDLLHANGVRLSQSLSPQTRRRPVLSGSLRLPGARYYWWAYLIVMLCLATIILRLTLALIAALTDPLTTLQYGEVRTTHLSAFFGLPEETSTNPSLLTATNDHGMGHIWFLPAGQVAQASVLELPLTDVDPNGRLPLLLTLADVDRDGHPDLLVTLGDGGPRYVFLLDTGKVILRSPTPAEQRRLVLPNLTQ